MFKVLFGALKGTVVFKRYVKKDCLCVVINTDNQDILVYSLLHLKDALNESGKSKMIVFSAIDIPEKLIDQFISGYGNFVYDTKKTHELYCYSKFSKNWLGTLIGKAFDGLRIVSNYDYTGLKIKGFMVRNDCNVEYLVCDRLLLLKNIEVENIDENQLREIKEQVRCL